MKKEWLVKTLAFGTIIFFICVSILPIIESLPIKKQANYELLPIENLIKTDSGISLITLKVTSVTGGDNWYGCDNSFTFICESDEIAEIYYGIDGNWSLYTGMFNVPDGGEHILEWYAVNHQGNQSEVDGPFFFKVDKTPPDIILTYELTYNFLIKIFEFTFTAAASDSMSGMDYVEFYVNDVLQETVTGSLPTYKWRLWLKDDIKMNVSAKAFDIAGNSAIDVIIDPWPFYLQNFSNEIFSFEIAERKNNKINEKSFFDISANEFFDPASVIVVFNRKIGENEWIDSNVSLSIFYESDRIDKVFYQINNGSWMLYTKPIVISEDGNYFFSWYIIDSEGYNSTIESISFKVDLTSPEINLIRKRLAIIKVKFVADVYDATSSVDRVRFQSKYGWGFTDYDYPYEWIWTRFFNDIVTATVYDKAGNRISCSMKTWGSLSYSQQRIQRFSIPLFIQILLRLMNIKLYCF